MKKQLLSIFECCRNRVIELLYEYVDKTSDKIVLLDEYPVEYSLEIEESICQNLYQMLKIENGILFVHYSYGIGIEPIEFEDIIEDIELFSLDEIFNIINHIKE